MLIKKVVIVPDSVQVLVHGGRISVIGKLGKLTYLFNKFVDVQLSDVKYLNIYSKCSSVNTKCLIGTTYSLIKGMIVGVSVGFTKKLQLIGIGYKVSFEQNANTLILMIGLSHPVRYRLPVNIKAQCINQTEIIVTGIDKQLVGQVAANLRAIRPPEPFKGKGIRYFNEFIYNKDTKKK